MSNNQSQNTNNTDNSENIPPSNAPANQSSQSNSGEREYSSRYKVGQALKMVRVRFPGNAKSFPFIIGKRRLSYGQKVMAMSDRGMAVGYINSLPYDILYKESLEPIKSISKVATDDDITTEIETYRQQKKYETICQDLITKHDLNMNMTHVEFTQFGKKVVFYFTAPERVDFRGLVKDLVTELKLRIELRQISLRDRAASIGSLGPCGRELCCSSFLSRYGHVNVKMAKNQNLTLNYSRLNGVCGQLKCCLQYEDDVYAQKRKKLPEIGQLIICENGDKGRVERLNILSEQYDMITIRGVIRRYSISQFKSVDNEIRMPRKFDHITNETNSVVGLEDYLSTQTRNFEKDMEKLKANAPDYAQEIFDEYLGEEVAQFRSQIDGQNAKAGIEAVDRERKVKPTISLDSFAPKATEQNTDIKAKTEEKSSTATTEQKDLKANKPPEKSNKKPYKKRFNNKNRNNKNNRNKKNSNNSTKQ